MENEKKKNDITSIVILIVSIIMAVFQFYTAANRPLASMTQRPLHFMFALVLLWLYEAQKCKHLLTKILYWALAVLSVVANVYIMKNWVYISRRTTALTQIDILISIVIIALILYGTWRSVSIWMMGVGGVFLLYAAFGQYLPGVFQHTGMSLNRALSNVVMASEGVFGSTMSVSATYIFMFIMFGEFLVAFGAGQFIIDLAYCAFGKFRGGALKVAVLASGLFGMVSGSAAANVMGTGTFTIPLIKRRNYDSETAGAIVAAASTGGLIMPPVMGAAAFLMADYLGIPYGELCLYALLPAAFYFLNLFFVSDLRAIRLGDLGIEKSQLPSIKKVLKEGWHHLLCIFALVLFLCILRYSASKSCVYSIVVLLAADYCRRLISRDKFNLKEELLRFKDIAVNSCKGCLSVCLACACAGIIVGIFSASGLNLRFSRIIIELAHGNMLVLLILAMIGALVLGMGMPSVSVYIVMAIMVAPALIAMGITPLAAHMFLFYFGILAPITPPVGIAFYAASSVAKSNPMKTGFISWRMAIPGFILPFLFVYDNGILLNGGAAQSAWACVYAIIGLLGLAIAFEGNVGRHLVNPVLRILLFAFSFATVVPEIASTLIGIIGIIGICIATVLKGKMIQHEAEDSTAAENA